MEKNQTIVSFPLINLDLKSYIDLSEMKTDDPNFSTKYNLIANICHEGTSTNGFYKVHIKKKLINQWYEIQDLHI